MSFNLLKQLSSVTEMAKPAQSCPKCGLSPLSKTHRYYKGAWVCPPGATQQTGQPAASAVAPAPKVAAPTTAAAPVAAPKVAAPTAPTTATAPAASAAGSKAPIVAQIEQWLARFGVKKFTINPDLTVEIKQTAEFDDVRTHKLPVKLTTVNGDFIVSASLLKTLENGPDKVTGDFFMLYSDLTSLQHSPTEVGGDFNVTGNTMLTSFEGAPQKVGGDVEISECGFTSLQGIHKHIKSMNGTLQASGCDIKSHVLGVFMVRGLKKLVIDNDAVAKIVNKHLPERDANACQEELIEAGFGEFAKL